MDPENNLSVPFLTRKMLSFEHAVAFDLEVVSISSNANRVNVTGLTREGMFKFTYIHAGDNTEQTDLFRIPDIPIILTVVSPSYAISRGDHFVSVFLRANGERILKLMSGYVYNLASLNWPTPQPESEINGRGGFAAILGDNPAAGSEATVDVPSNQVWKIHGFGVTLVTDATVANRRVGLEWMPNGDSYALQTYSTVDQVASLTTKHNFMPVGAHLGALVNSTIVVPIPSDIMVVEGGEIRTKTLNLQAADDFGPPQIFIERFITI